MESPGTITEAKMVFTGSTPWLCYSTCSRVLIYTIARIPWHSCQQAYSTCYFSLCLAKAKVKITSRMLFHTSSYSMLWVTPPTQTEKQGIEKCDYWNVTFFKKQTKKKTKTNRNWRDPNYTIPKSSFLSMKTEPCLCLSCSLNRMTFQS